MTAHDGLGSVRADARKATTETHWDPATARLIDTAVAARDAWWRGQIEALASRIERAAINARRAASGQTDAAWSRLDGMATQAEAAVIDLRQMLDAVPQPETTPERGDTPSAERHAYFGNVCSGFGAPLICMICNRDMFDPIHRESTAQPVPAPSDWHDPAQREAAGMGRDHDRTILEGALEHDRTVVMVRCPHTVGLCYLTDGPDGEEGWLANLPCPCNDRSEIVAHVVPTVPGVCGVQYGDNPDRYRLRAALAAAEGDKA